MPTTTFTTRSGRVVGTLACLPLALGALAACGGSSGGSGTPSASGAASSAAGAATSAAGAATSAAGGASSAAAGAGGGTASDTGVTATTVTIGTHTPLTGPAAAGYSKISAAQTAYFKYVNSQGGIDGRTIELKVEDDSYSPAKTDAVVKKLVLQDKVFGILSGLGTPTHSNVVDFLAQQEVPDLFVASGSLNWNKPADLPTTFGWQADYRIEGKVFGDYIKKNLADKKTCVFGQADDFGKDGLSGVEKTLGADKIADRQTYTPTNPDFSAQVGSMKGKGCQVVVAFTTPSFTALLLGTGAKAGFTPQYLVSNVGSDYTTLSSRLMAAAPALTEGIVSNSYMPFPDDASNPWITLFKMVNDKYNGGVPFDGNVEYGMANAYTFLQALKAAGPNPTRKAIVAAIEDKGKTFTGPGLVPFRFSADDHSGYSGVRLGKFSGGKVTPIGNPVTTGDGDEPLTDYTTPQPAPPANGIPQ